MGFFKKVGKAIGGVFKKVISPAAGLASKLVGGLNIPVISGAANLAGKLLQSAPSSPSKSAAKAKVTAASKASFPAGTVTAPSLTAVQQAAFKGGTVGVIVDQLKGSWFQRNMAWVIPSAVSLLIGIIYLFFSIFKKRK